MKTIHHIIVAAMDAGMNVNEAETLATELLGEPNPITALRARIAKVDTELGRLTNYRHALDTIRNKWGVNGLQDERQTPAEVVV